MTCTRTLKIALALIVAFSGFWAMNHAAEARDRGYKTVAGDGRYTNTALSHNYKSRKSLQRKRRYRESYVSNTRPDLFRDQQRARHDYRPGRKYSDRRDYKPGRKLTNKRDYRSSRRLTNRRNYRPSRRLTNRRNVRNTRGYKNRSAGRNGYRNLRGSGSALAGALFVIDGNEIIAEGQAERERQLGSQLRNKVSYYPRRTRSKFIRVTAEQLALGEERAARRDERMMAQMDDLDIRYYRDTEAYDARFPSIVYLDVIGK